MVNVRPVGAQRFVVHAAPEGAANAPRIAEAGGRRDRRIAAPAPATRAGDRDESELAWRLRHLKRGVLRERRRWPAVPQDDDWFITDSFEFLGRAVGTSARAADSALQRSLARRPGQPADHRRVRQSAAAAAAGSHQQRRVLLASARRSARTAIGTFARR